MAPTVALMAEPAPLQPDADHVIRVANTRVTLDTVVAAYERGATPEQIADDYDVLSLADFYATIAYYLRHRAEVPSYLDERRRIAASTRKSGEQRGGQDSLRGRLLARCRSGRSCVVSTIQRERGRERSSTPALGPHVQTEEHASLPHLVTPGCGARPIVAPWRGGSSTAWRLARLTSSRITVNKSNRGQSAAQ